MSGIPSPEHAAVLLRQGRAWVARLAEVEAWPADELREHHDRLRVCPLASLAAVVERYRSRMIAAEERRGMRPVIERKLPPGAKPTAPREHRPRGLAKHLKRTPIATSAQHELFPKAEE